VTQHLAFVSFPADAPPDQASAQIVENQPRAIAWDPARDTFHVTGLGSDTLLQLPGLTRSTNDGLESQASNFVLRATARCGPDGLAITGDGKLLVWCSFSRTVLRLATLGPELAEQQVLLEGPALAASSFTPEQHRGRVLFHTTDPAVNRDRALTCSTCHPDGRADGLSWKVANQTLQTPILAGRVAGTQPYKWDGSDALLEASLRRTVGRLGGSGLDDEQAASLVAYVQALPRPRAPTRDPAAVARGKAVFDGGGCRACHAGPTYSDGLRHNFSSTLPDADTPSLIGLAASAPYYHDGSAASLDILLRGGGAVHGMIDTSSFDDAQTRDLVTFLESL
jgi:cytochrome c553